MTPAEQAARIWERARHAAMSLASVRVGGNFSYIQLGSSLPEELVRELAAAAQVRLEAYRHIAEHSSVEMVFVAFRADVNGIEVSGFHARPATPADAALPMRGGRA